MDALSEIRSHFGNVFDCHLWITRQETAASDSASHDKITIHRHQAATPEQAGNPWEWWASFSDQALEHFDTKDNRDKSLVYICGPQGLTDRLVEVYKERGLQTSDGHVQVEKWW
jgi:NAD(P)H-flavin reductase